MSSGFLDGEENLGGRGLDRLDPRSRVLAAVAVVIAVLALRSTAVLAATLPALVVAALISGLSARDLARRMAHLEGFLIVLAILLPLTVAGPTVGRIGPFAVTETGLARAGVLLLRVNATALVLVTLLGGLEPIRFGHALARLGVPAKLVHLLLFTARWVDLVRGEARRLEESMRIRAFRVHLGPHGLRTLGAFVGQLLVRAFERAERVEEAMRCRAFAGRFALLGEDRFSRSDLVFAAAVAAVVLLLPTLDRIA